MKDPRTEDAVVVRLQKLLGRPAHGVHAGIGDDCAAVRSGAGRLTLLKTDCVVERRHFLPRDAASSVGWKAASRAVSDIAACGGEPRFALVTCVLRREQGGRWIDGLYRGIRKAARAYGFTVVGGELARTDGPAVVNVAMTGEVRQREFVGRGGGRPGDVLFVTGRLGGSLASGWHLKFRPRLAEARWLARNFRPRAMMDLSDGLAADLPRLAAASRCGYVVETGAVPCRSGVTLRGALGDGEDFELLFAVSPRMAAGLEARWRGKFPRVRLTRIGRLASRGTMEGLGAVRGFDHFAR